MALRKIALRHRLFGVCEGHACREIHLLHLSDATSHEEHFINKVRRCVPAGIQVDAACRGK